MLIVIALATSFCIISCIYIHYTYSFVRHDYVRWFIWSLLITHYNYDHCISICFDILFIEKIAEINLIELIVRCACPFPPSTMTQNSPCGTGSRWTWPPTEARRCRWRSLWATSRRSISWRSPCCPRESVCSTHSSCPRLSSRRDSH